MDIGTAKPTAAEQAEVPHHLLDLADPDDDFSVARVPGRGPRRARRDRGPGPPRAAGRRHRALPAGGRRRPRIPGRWPEVRAELEAEARHGRRSTPGCAALDPVAAGRMEPTNARRIVRALEVTARQRPPFSLLRPRARRPPADAASAWSAWPCRPTSVDEPHRAPLPPAARRRVPRRGPGAGARPAGLSRTARQALGYRELLAHLDGDAHARRGRRPRRPPDPPLRPPPAAWFRRDPRIRWIRARALAADELPAAERPSAVAADLARRDRQTDARAADQAPRPRQRLPRPARPATASHPSTPAWPRRLCDRHRGIGADGLLGPRPGAGRDGADVAMVLLNADGEPGRDERQRHPLPGPGAVLTPAWRPTPSVSVATDAGPAARSTSDEPVDAGTHVAAVDMGPATRRRATSRSGPAATSSGPGRVDMGNPHLVLHAADRGRAVDDRALVERWAAGQRRRPRAGSTSSSSPSRRPDGSAWTCTSAASASPLACGTGACAAAAAAHAGASSATGGRAHAAAARHDVDARRQRRSCMTTPIDFIGSIDVPLALIGCPSRAWLLAVPAHRAGLPGEDRPRRRRHSAARRVDDADASLDELPLLVDTAGADDVGRVVQRRDAPDPRHLRRQGQGRGAARAVRGGRQRHGRLRRRADPGPAVQPREAARAARPSTAPR